MAVVDLSIHLHPLVLALKDRNFDTCVDGISSSWPGSSVHGRSPFLAELQLPISLHLLHI